MGMEAEGVLQSPPSPGAVFPWVHTGRPFRGLSEKGAEEDGGRMSGI